MRSQSRGQRQRVRPTAAADSSKCAHVLVVGIYSRASSQKSRTVTLAHQRLFPFFLCCVLIGRYLGVGCCHHRSTFGGRSPILRVCDLACPRLNPSNASAPSHNPLWILSRAELDRAERAVGLTQSRWPQAGGGLEGQGTTLGPRSTPAGLPNFCTGESWFQV